MTSPATVALATTLSALCLATTASAAVPGYTHSGGFASVGPLRVTIGFGVYTHQSVTVTDLGVFDYELDGFTDAMPVGLWNASGTLLTSSAVPAGTAGTLVDGFRYVPIAPITLDADAVYWFGNLTTTSDAFMSSVTPVAGPEFSIVNGGSQTPFRRGTTLQFPNEDAQWGTIASVNFLYAVPEPTSLAALGVGAFALLRRYRK